MSGPGIARHLTDRHTDRPRGRKTDRSGGDDVEDDDACVRTPPVMISVQTRRENEGEHGRGQGAIINTRSNY